MVALPLFKLASLFLRHVSKYGANRIKVQAHDHPRFRVFAAKYGQSIHQLNMRLSVALLRDVEAEIRAKEKAEAPTVKTKGQIEKEEEIRAKHGTTNQETRARKTLPIISVWRRKFRPLPEAKAVDLFADVVGDGFILLVGTVLILYEYHRSSQKPDTNLEKIKELNTLFEELDRREKALEEAEKRQQSRVLILEEALRGLKDPKTQRPLLPPTPTASPSA
ncbi:optic atrophy 3-like protein [Annulohypoxylon maeteangense]|uniref:optic atrophy 3-like protein n=1 Tax=Annulohypoxylon maeteangense TaxID=1927788 RepID=UPI002007CB70|nr:optic atrophy 3-like protein [Annulohypoxylon maeteangense]KAI0890044.1 optic atrophy 3-like protein [Annulohypoxylon maeteangense]